MNERGEIGLFFLSRRSKPRASEAHAREKISEGTKEEPDDASSRGACFSFSLSSCVLPDGRYATYPFFLGSVFSSSVSLWSSSKIFKNSFFLLSTTTLNERGALCEGKKNTLRITNANRTVISIVCLVHLQLTKRLSISCHSYLIYRATMVKSYRRRSSPRRKPRRRVCES